MTNENKMTRQQRLEELKRFINGQIEAYEFMGELNEEDNFMLDHHREVLYFLNCITMKTPE